MFIYIEVPEDRTKTCTIRAKDKSGNLIFYDTLAYTKAEQAIAAGNNNPDCDPLKLYGDTPLGEYYIVDIIPSGNGTKFNTADFGPHGVIRLQPKQGDALKAFANGRNGFLIHGGDPGPKGGLRRTNGSIRLSNSDMSKLVTALQSPGNSFPGTCEIRNHNNPLIGIAEENVDRDYGEPPRTMRRTWAIDGIYQPPKKISFSIQNFVIRGLLPPDGDPLRIWTGDQKWPKNKTNFEQYEAAEIAFGHGFRAKPSDRKAGKEQILIPGFNIHHGYARIQLGWRAHKEVRLHPDYFDGICTMNVYARVNNGNLDLSIPPNEYEFTWNRSWVAKIIDTLIIFGDPIKDWLVKAVGEILRRKILQEVRKAVIDAIQGQFKLWKLISISFQRPQWEQPGSILVTIEEEID